MILCQCSVVISLMKVHHEVIMSCLTAINNIIYLHNIVYLYINWYLDIENITVKLCKCKYNCMCNV